MSQTINGHRIETDNEITVGQAIHGHGIVVREYKTLKPSLSMCKGCRDDFYNYGNNSCSGRCWGFEDAKVVDKVGHSTLNICGGPDTLMKKTLSCWHAVRK